ncbi:GTP-binding protein HflX [Erysipelotrichaceae bacterium]|nr:GTP-binding protein HflX [Erysipelotrichaceae bacterium]
MIKEIQQVAVLVAADINSNPRFEYSVKELVNLTLACNIEVAGTITQNLHQVHARHYVGQGKLEEIRAMVEATDANLCIFNTELTPSQLRKIEEILECKIIDRTMLILEIFNTRANTKESQLQVDIAKLRYFLPRLSGLRSSLGRQAGGVGTKNKGLGEKKLELDRRRIENQILLMQGELKEIISQRQTQRSWRKKEGIKTVALVGYTNAGKSTLMNTIIDMYIADHDVEKKVFTKDMLFATLQTAVRRIEMPDNRSFLLTDTVGFVSDLPHHLVDAFKSTLEEIKEADLLVHVVDCSDESAAEMIMVTTQTLEALGAKNMPTIYAYNKADLLPKDQLIAPAGEDIFYISALSGMGMEALIGGIVANIYAHYRRYQISIPYTRGDITAYYHQNTKIEVENFTSDATELTVVCSEKKANKFKDSGILITLLDED